MTSPCISGEDKVKVAGEQCRGAQAEQLERLKVIIVMMMMVVVMIVMMLVTMIFMRTVMLIMMMMTFFDLAMAQAHIICE